MTGTFLLCQQNKQKEIKPKGALLKKKIFNVFRYPRQSHDETTEVLLYQREFKSNVQYGLVFPLPTESGWLIQQ